MGGKREKKEGRILVLKNGGRVVILNGRSMALEMIVGRQRMLKNTFLNKLKLLSCFSSTMQKSIPSCLVMMPE